MRSSLAALALFTLASTNGGSAAPGVQLPDPRTGVVDGRMATLVWPGRYVEGKEAEPIPAEDCVAHFVSGSNLDVESVHPCGKWLRLKPGFYKVWAEGDDYISPTYWSLRYNDDPFNGKGLIGLIPVVPAGQVRLARPLKGTKTALRLLSLSATDHLPGHPRAFDRRVAPPGSSALMPVGKALAGLFDPVTGDAVALSRPFVVTAGATTTIDPAPPADSDVLVVLQRPLEAHAAQVNLTLKEGEAARRPDVVLHAADATFAVWYGVRGRNARVTVESDRLAFPAFDLRLRPGSVSTHRGKMTLLPKLGVSVNVPEKAFKDLAIAVRHADDPAPVRQSPIAPNVKQTFESVPAGLLHVTVKGDQWEWDQEVDLTDGADRDIVFDLNPVTVAGTLYLGSDRVPGTVTFDLDQKIQVAVETDEKGRYEAILWRQGLYDAAVRVSGDEAEPFLELVDVDGDTTFDFRVPATRVVATVVDAVSRRPVPGAIVGVMSKYDDPIRAGMTRANAYEADQSGKVVLPRLRPGRAEIGARAEGYEQSEVYVLEVQRDTETDVTLLLQPFDAARVTVLLPDGRPAAGAEACAFAGPAFERVWCEKVDGAGVLRANKRDPNGLLLIRHQSAGTLVVTVGQLQESVRMPPAASVPLFIHTEGPNGEPMRFALVTIWLSDVRLTGGAAAYATWNGGPVTDSTGTWIARNLPVSPLRVLATRGTSPAQIASGAYDSLATTISHPWPASAVPLRAIE